MPYVTQSRPYIPDGLREYVDEDNHLRVRIPCGTETRITKSTGFTTVTNLEHTFVGSSGTTGNQTTTSWRTGKSLEDAGINSNQAIPGDEMIRIIRRGGDVDNTGTVGGIRDRGRNKFGAPATDTGHTFYTTLVDRSKSFPSSPVLPSVTCRLRREDARYIYILDYTGTGPFRTFPFNWLPDNPISESQRLATGTKLLERAIPTRPNVNIIESIGELIKDGLPTVPGKQFRNSKTRLQGIGSEYLNWEFGFQPIANDIANILVTVIKSSEILEDYMNNSEKWIHRKRSMGPEIETQHDELPIDSNTIYWGAVRAGTASQVNLKPYLDPSSGRIQRITTSELRSNFSGEFTYYVPTGDDVLSRFKRYSQQANHLLGTDLDAYDFWEIAPWSFLIDWVADFGAIFNTSTLLSKDNLVMKYGYVMNQYSSNVSLFYSGFRDRFGNKIPATFMEASRVTKYRDRATPYGFNVSTDDFTNYQWSIIAALALGFDGKLRLNEPR